MKTWLYVNLLMFFVVTLSLQSHIYAQSKGGKKSGKAKRQVIDFEDQLVEGEVSKSELLLLLQKKRYNFGRLIKLREDFLPEMRRSESNIKIGSK